MNDGQRKLEAKFNKKSGNSLTMLKHNIANVDLNLSHNGELSMLLAAQSMAVGTVIIRYIVNNLFIYITI